MTDAEAKVPILWHLMQTANLLEKTLMLGKIERQKEKRVIEDEMVGGHHQFSEFTWADSQRW